MKRMLESALPAALALAALVAAAFGGASAHVSAQPPQDAVAVTGIVLDRFTGAPVAGAEVRVTVGGDVRAFETDAEGRFTMEGMALGDYFIAIGRGGYETLEGDLTIDRPGEFFLPMTPVDADPGDLTGIVGVVTDMATGRPIPDVVVSVPALGRAATSDSEGRFDILEMAPGAHEVVMTHIGYRRRTETVRVSQGRVSRMEAGLAVEAIPLDPIDVTVERRDATLQRVGFYQREEDGWGDFISREDLETWASPRLSDAMLRIPGVTTVHDPAMPSQSYVMLRRAGKQCFPPVYLDGMRVHGGGDEPARINDLVAPIAVAGVEVYRGVAGVPPQYWSDASCGVVLIWVRRGR